MNQNRTTEPFELSKTRNLLQHFKDTYGFLNNNAEMMFRAVGIYSLSVLCFALLFAHFSLGSIPTIEHILSLNHDTTKRELILTILSTFFYAFSFCTLTFVISRLLLLRNTYKSEESTFVFSEFEVDFFPRLKTYFVNFFIVYILFHLLYYFGATPQRISSLHTPYDNLSEIGNIIYGDGFNFERLFNKLLQNVLLIIFMPAFMYFGITSLYVSVKEGIGSTDALVKIFRSSKNNIPVIWLFSFVFLLVAWLADSALFFRTQSIAFILPFNSWSFFLLYWLKTMLSVFFFVFLQIAVVLIYEGFKDKKPQFIFAKSDSEEANGQPTETEGDKEEFKPEPGVEITNDYEKIISECPKCRSNKVYRRKGALFSPETKGHVCKHCGYMWEE